MCGRYTLAHPPAELGPLFHVTPVAYEPRYNLAPTQDAPIVRRLADGNREMLMARWGLLPHWADPDTFKATLFNARSESAADKPSFRDALRTGRCLVPASSFFEWRTEAGGRQPYTIHRRDGRPLALAGLWSLNARGAEPVLSFAILTTRPNAFLQQLHDRQPVILDPEDFDAWLDPSVRDARQLEPLFAPGSAEELTAVPVSARVNHPGNDAPELLEPTGDPLPTPEGGAP